MTIRLPATVHGSASRLSSSAVSSQQFLRLILVSAVFLAAGAAISLATLPTLVVVLSIAVSLAAFFAPVAVAVPATVCGAAIVPVSLAEQHVRGLPLGRTPLGGHGYFLLSLLFIIALRCGGRSRPAIRLSFAHRAVVLYSVLLLIEAVTAVVGGHNYSGMWAALYRQLSYTAAFWIAVTATKDAVRRGRVIGLFRAVGATSAFVFASCLVFWMSQRGYVHAPNAVARLFTDVRTYLAGAGRVSFPFIDDSPPHRRRRVRPPCLNTDADTSRLGHPS